MAKRKTNRFLSMLLVISLLFSLAAPSFENIAAAEEEQAPGLTKELIMQRFGASGGFIEQEMDGGLSLNNIYSLLFVAEIEAITYEVAKERAFAPELNLSQIAVSEGENGNLPLELVLLDEGTTVAGQVYGQEPAFSELLVVPAGSAPPDDWSEPSEMTLPVEPEATIESVGMSEQKEPEPAGEPEQNSLEAIHLSTNRVSEEVKLVNPFETLPASTDTLTETVFTNKQDTPVRKSDSDKDKNSIDDEEVLTVTELESLETEGLEDNMVAEGKMQALSTIQPPERIEEAPVYQSSTISQAPYSVSLSNENISSLSGSLTVEASDMQLPGRNGLSFVLQRQYNSDDAAFYGMQYEAEYNPYRIYHYYVSFQVKKVPIFYDLNYTEKSSLQYDYNGDGVPDENGFVPSRKTITHASYSTLTQAQQAYGRGVSYTIPAENRIQTTFRSGSLSSLPSSISYNEGGFSGTLGKSGNAYVISGSYLSAAQETRTASCTNTLPGKYDANGQWYATGNYTNPCPTTISYNKDGFSGTLSRVGDAVSVKACSSPAPKGQEGWVCTREWRADYSGTVTKPAVDTRVWRQDYTGTVIKPATSSQSKTSAWRTVGSMRERTLYEIESVRIEEREGQAVFGTRYTNPTADYTGTLALQSSLNAASNAFIENADGYDYYVSSSPQATLMSVQVGEVPGYRYYNKTVQTQNEKRYPIGKGWSWKLPYVELDNGKQILHLADGGSYVVENGDLKDYPWLGLSLKEDNTVQVNGQSSKFVLTSADNLVRQYFSGDGDLLQIRDAYNNTISFTYSQHAAYGRKLLSSVTGSTGSQLSIAYSDTQVVLSKGNEQVVYEKRKENGQELLGAVVDNGGRRTTYSYQIAPAKFNLIGQEENRAISNPYALLTKVQHPTGAITEYTYEPSPVKRYMGESSFKEAYRMSARGDRLLYADGSSFLTNYQALSYTGDFMQAYNQSYTINTVINNGLTSTAFQYKKEFLGDTQSPQFYLEAQTASAEGVEKRTTHTYDKKVGNRTYAVAYPTVVTVSDNVTADKLITSTRYDDYGNVLSVVSPTGAVTTNTYDPINKWLISTKQQVDDNTFIYTEWVRNAQGTVLEAIVRQNDGNGAILNQTTQGGIDSFGNPSTITYANGNQPQIIQLMYDEATHSFPVKQSTAVTNSTGQQTIIEQQFSFDPSSGRLLSATDGNGYTTAYSYDALGRISLVIHPDSAQLRVAYDDLNNKVTVTDEAGRQQQVLYNGLGWQVEEGYISADGYRMKSRLGYDAYGRAIWSEDAEQKRTGQAYDAWSRPIKTIYPNLTESTVNYLDATREVISTDSVGNAGIQTFDKFGQLLKQEEKSSAGSRKVVQENSYHPLNGTLTQQKDGNGQATIYVYTLLGQLSAVTNAKGETTSYTYDQLGRHLQTIFADGNSVKKVYNEAGQLLRNIDASGKADTYDYDANGNRSRLIDKKGQSFIYTYNNRNWLLSKKGPSETIAFTYNPDGSRASMSDITGTTSYQYDTYTGEQLALIYPDGKTIQYTYNSLGQRSGMTTPFGDQVGYRYNGMNQLKELSWNGIVQQSYDYLPNGQLVKETTANSLTTAYTYDISSLNRLVQQSATGDELKSYDYGYDPGRNITKITEKTNGALTADDGFSYDPLNRIQTATPNQETYTYDKRGNRQTLMTASPDLLFSNRTYAYDEWDRLTQATPDGSADVTYKYNGDNLMVGRTEGGVTTRYYYDGAQIIAEGVVQQDGSVVEKVSYLRGSKLVMLEQGDGRKGYYGHNGHGDVVSITDTSGQALNTYAYDLWGNPTKESEQVDNSFRYSGEFWDNSTDLQYLRARWYDPSVGRFINEDTYEGELKYPLSFNLYTYVLNNPLRYSDPSGNYCVSADGKWAHGDPCSSSSSIEMGDNKNFTGSPIIENGIIKGYIGKNGPFAEKEFNYWKEFGNGVVTGSADAVLGKYVYDQLMSTKREVVSVAAIGPAHKMDHYVFPSRLDKTIAKLSKTAGLVSLGVTGLEIYNDFQNYTGTDRYWASLLTIAGTGATIGGTVLVTVALTALTGGGFLVAIAAFGAGTAIGAGVSAGVDYLKKEYLK